MQSPIHSPVDRVILYGQCGGESDKKGDGANGEAMCVCVLNGGQGPGNLPTYRDRGNLPCSCAFSCLQIPYLIVLSDASQRVNGHTYHPKSTLRGAPKRPPPNRSAPMEVWGEGGVRRAGTAQRDSGFVPELGSCGFD